MINARNEGNSDHYSDVLFTYRWAVMTRLSNVFAHSLVMAQWFPIE